MTAKTKKRPVSAAPTTELVRQQEKAALPECKDDNSSPASGNQGSRALFQTGHNELRNDILNQSVCCRSSKSDDELISRVMMNLMELKPESYLETLLITQMLQVQQAASICMKRAFAEEQTFQGKELNGNLAVKMHRTFLAQIEALQKLRGKGGQKVTVEHVTVNAGGQAIVGNVEHR